MTLENGDLLRVEKIAREEADKAVDSCPQAELLILQYQNLKKEVGEMKETHREIFKKIDGFGKIAITTLITGIFTLITILSSVALAYIQLTK